MPAPSIVDPRTYVRNLLANWIGVISETAIAFFLTPFVLASLGEARYGLWGLLNALLGYFGLVDLGIRDGVGRYTAQYLARRDPERVREVITTSVVALTGLSVIVVAVSIVIGVYFPVFFSKTPTAFAPEIALALPIMALGLWITMLSSVLRSLLISHDRFDLATGIQTGVTLLRAAGVVLVLRAGYGLVALALVAAGATIFGAFALLIAGRRVFGPFGATRRYVSGERFREVWKFGIANLVYRLANQLIYQTDQLVVMLFFGPAAVAAYSIGSMLCQTGQLAVQRIGGTFYPSVIRAGSLNDLDGLRRTFFWQARLSFLFGILVYVGLAAFGRRFCDVWLGPGFESTAQVLAVLSLAELASLAASSGGSALFALSRMKFNLVSSISEAALNLLLSILFVTVLHTGMIGVALGTLGSAIVWRGVIHPLYTSRVLGFGFRQYMAQVGARVLLLSVAFYVIFAALAHRTEPGAWVPFLLAVGIGIALYLPAAMGLLLPRDLWRSLWARLAPSAGK